MDNLAPRIQDVVRRLSGNNVLDPASARPPDRTATEAAYRQTLCRWFELTAKGLAADPVEVSQVHQEILRLIDEVGEPRATRLRQRWAREWWQETGLCPFCGERGSYHDPTQGSELADA